MEHAVHISFVIGKICLPAHYHKPNQCLEDEAHETDAVAVSVEWGVGLCIHVCTRTSDHEEDRYGKVGAVQGSAGKLGLGGRRGSLGRKHNSAREWSGFRGILRGIEGLVGNGKWAMGNWGIKVWVFANGERRRKGSRKGVDVLAA
jgi:hypothetical protein